MLFIIVVGINYCMHACTVLLGHQEHKAWPVPRYYIMVTKMAHRHIKEFDLTKETIDNFRQRFKFYCAANNIKSDDEAQQACKKALFITMLGQKLLS